MGRSSSHAELRWTGLQFPRVTTATDLRAPVCLWCPNIKSPVMSLHWLDWWWRHMGLIRRSFNLCLCHRAQSRETD